MSVYYVREEDVPISGFIGDFRFLSNPYKSKFSYNGRIFRSSEARKLGNRVHVKEDWEIVKDQVMLDTLRDKFSKSPLREELLMTGNREIVAENNWGDQYWGVCQGRGENRLGGLTYASKGRAI